MLGRTLTSVKVKSNEHEITINTGKWAEGVYIYSLYVNGEFIASEKMVIES